MEWEGVSPRTMYGNRGGGGSVEVTLQIKITLGMFPDDKFKEIKKKKFENHFQISDLTLFPLFPY